MKKIALFFVYAAMSSQPSLAQKQWSLRECCDYAVAHNISIRQQENA